MGTFDEIWDIVRQIPAGKVATYGQIARMTGRPRGARLVGWAMASCPAGSGVPCHRVVDRAGGTKRAFDEYMPGGRGVPPGRHGGHGPVPVAAGMRTDI